MYVSFNKLITLSQIYVIINTIHLYLGFGKKITYFKNIIKVILFKYVSGTKFIAPPNILFNTQI